MENPTIVQAPIGASAIAYTSSIPLIRSRGFSITGRVKFHGSATGNAVLQIEYSPNGSDWDTILFGSLTLTVSAGNEVQASSYVVVPEHGYLRLSIKNEDATYPLAWGKIWYSVQSFPFDIGIHHGSITNEGED